MKPRFNFFATLFRSPSGGSEGSDAASPTSTGSGGSPSPSPSSSDSGLPASSPSPSGGNEGSGVVPASPTSPVTSGGDFFLDRDDDDEDFDLSGVTSEDSGVREVSFPPSQQQQVTPAVVTPPAPVISAAQQQGQDPSQQTSPQTQAIPSAQGGEENVQPFHANPNKFLKQLSDNREAIIEALAKERFALTDDEAIAFEENPTEALSRMGAKLYYDAMTATMARMAEVVPAMIANYQEAVKSSSKSEDFFFGKWPQLDRGKHMTEVVRVGQMYRQMNPKATSEQFVNDVGLMVVTSLGLTGKAPPQQGKNGGGFRPAIGGGGALGNGNSSLGNGQDPWSGLGMDFEE